MAEERPGGSRYTAFLSYSHKDAAAAGRLHRRLETYRLPKRLVGKATTRGPVPQRLWPVFRDRDELPAATDLSETVREALAQSGSLIVLCSAHSAESLWVAAEIKVFRELHPDRPVLAAVIEGDPPACFPPALRAFGRDGTWHEPLATDLRPRGDGPQLGLLKLVAGITGVGLDDLVQRDAHRKIRRVTAVTAVAVAAMLVMAVLMVVALTARAEAERQRAEAEGLIDFMLTDLRDDLKAEGRLRVMEGVNERALDYYEHGGPIQNLSDESLALRARILHAIGDDSLARHDFDSALSAFGQAREITVEQLQRAPSDPDRIFAHAKSDLGIGRVYESRHQWGAARRYFAASAAAAGRLVNASPDNPDYMMKAGSSALNLGNVELRGSQNPGSAQQWYVRAVRWFDRAAEARPNDLHVRLAQANAYASLADSFYLDRKWRESLRERLRQYAIVKRLQRSDPRNTEFVFRLGAAQRGVAYSLFCVGDHSEAGQILRDAYRSSARLTARDPLNAEWRTLERALRSDFERMGFSFPSGVPADRDVGHANMIRLCHGHDETVRQARVLRRGDH